MITGDFRNAFNSVRWKDIIQDYLSERTLEIDECMLKDTINIFSGVPRRLILDILLWNVPYDEVPRLGVSLGILLVGFANDVTDIVTVNGECLLITNVNFQHREDNASY